MFTHWPCPVRSSSIVGVLYVEVERQSSRDCGCATWELCVFILFVCGEISRGSRGSR